MLTFKQFRLRLDEIVNSLDESFYIFRTDTNTILARGLPDYESAKTRSNLIRKQLGLKWDQVGFRSERKKRSDKPFRTQPGYGKYAGTTPTASGVRTHYKDWDEGFLG